MRLVSYTAGAGVRTGALDRGVVIDLATTALALGGPAVPTDMVSFLAEGDRALDRAREAIDHVRTMGVEDLAGMPTGHRLDAVRLLAPLPRPNSLRDFLVVEEHVRRSLGGEIPPEWWNLPVYYKGNCDEVYGPDDVVPWPAFTERLDYELEICAVVGKPGRDVNEADAEDMIVGYTLFNDWSARDVQFQEMSVGLGPSYGKDFANSFGPAIVTKDEFDRNDAIMQARIDGETWSSGTLGTMRFSFEEIVTWVSRSQTLLPGDLLGSGTVGGGCGLELDRWIREGSVVELEADGIGVLRNTVGTRGGAR
jgi:2-keto-4-pentenoate hydratase/2-oxohepta-3-ene-1,7-dioic acid hydratase in catechol pathway